MSQVAPELVLLTLAGSGKGSRAAQIALRTWRGAGHTVQSLRGADPDAALALARDCVSRGVRTLVVCGGDEMVHLGIQAVAGTSTRLGIIPAGTGNDLARCLGIPRRDPAAAATIVSRGRTRRMDLGRVGSRYFATVLTAGWTIAELRTLRPVPYLLELDGQTLRLEATLVAVGNGPSFGGGLRIAEGALLDDGMLDVVVIKPIGRVELVKTYPKLFRGTHTTHPAYFHRRVRSVTVAAPGVIAYADGERVGALPLTVDVAPLALEVLLP